MYLIMHIGMYSRLRIFTVYQQILLESWLLCQRAPSKGSNQTVDARLIQGFTGYISRHIVQLNLGVPLEDKQVHNIISLNIHTQPTHHIT